ncbi:retrovirus-related pol polyprotein from transposon TNT 1-94 [Tanacetum coccineum]
MLPSTGRVSSTNVSELKPKSNTKNDRISQPSSRSKKNKVEAHHRKFKSSANKNNHVSDCNVNVKNVALSKNYDTICLSCNESIMGCGDLQIGNILISRVYYVERLGHNLFSVRQFFDSDLEVAFRKHTCFVWNLEGVDLLSGSCGSNLYTISMADMMKSSPICLPSKASKTKYWLWHCRLSHLNFGTINQLAKQGLVKGLPKMKYTKDHLCSACQMGKIKKESHPHKPEPSTNEKLQMLHMDLCGPMRVESINKKRYILVIIDDYFCFTWVKFLRMKDEAPEIIIKFLKQAQVSLNATDVLSQPMFDEYFKPPSAVSIPISATTLLPSDTTRATSSTSIGKDAPSPSTSPNNETTSPPINSTNVKEPHNEEVVEFDSDTFTNPLDTNSAESSSRIVDTSNLHTFQQPPIYTKRWTKDHPLTTIIGDPSKPVSTRC